MCVFLPHQPSNQHTDFHENSSPSRPTFPTVCNNNMKDSSTCKAGGILSSLTECPELKSVDGP